MSVLTSIETESAFMGNLRGRRRDMLDMTETNLGEIVQDFHWMVRTDLHLSQCQQNKKSSRWGVTHHTLFVLHIVLLDCFVTDQKQEEVIDIWRISMWREIQLYLSIILSIVIRYFFSFEKNKSSGRLLQSEDGFFQFAPAAVVVMLFHQVHLYTALTPSLK